jgi:hypothetical protein
MNLATGAYTTTLLVMVDSVKGEGVHPPPSQGWAEFTIMMEWTSDFAIASLFVLSRPCTLHFAHVNLYTFIPKNHDIVAATVTA